jgi:hypothetical protein
VGTAEERRAEELRRTAACGAALAQRKREAAYAEYLSKRSDGALPGAPGLGRLYSRQQEADQMRALVDYVRACA